MLTIFITFITLTVAALFLLLTLIAGDLRRRRIREQSAAFVARNQEALALVGELVAPHREAWAQVNTAQVNTAQVNTAQVNTARENTARATAQAEEKKEALPRPPPEPDESMALLEEFRQFADEKPAEVSHAIRTLLRDTDNQA